MLVPWVRTVSLTTGQGPLHQATFASGRLGRTRRSWWTQPWAAGFNSSRAMTCSTSCERVLEYPQLSSVLRTAGLTATEVVKLVMEVSIVFVPIRHATRARDADDNRVLDAAAAGSVDVIISGDADLLSLREYNGTPICGASDFVARMLQGT
jgi:putative PIN family toxin of toxin-antitoxin system